MKTLRAWLVLVVILAIFIIILFPWIKRGTKIAYEGWRADPVKMIAKLITAVIIGQGIGWVFGFDQIGFFMKPFFKVGVGQDLSVWLASYLPITVSIGWIVKLVEILADAIRVPVEAAVFFRYGFVPDVVATAITQPLWTVTEVVEKIAGVIVNPQLVGTREQVELSIGCIYGSLFRLIQNAVIWIFGYQIYKFLGVPVEKFIHWLGL